MTIKEQLFQACQDYLDERTQLIVTAMKDLEADLENETKSSAGDKYETGREMINLEWNKLSGQLQQFKRLKETLEMARKRKQNAKIQLGSLVITSTASYFIAIPAGQVILEGTRYFCIGANSPIAQALLNREKGAEISFNGNLIKVTSVE